MSDSRIVRRAHGAELPELGYVVSIAVRRRRLMVFLLAAILLGVALYVLPQPLRYTAHTKLLLNRGRIDMLVSPDSKAVPRLSSSVTIEEINTELELLRSHALLREVAVACGLHIQTNAPSGWAALKLRLRSAKGQPPASEEYRIARAAARLGAKLELQPMRQSNLIRASYSSTDPELAARVLNTLSGLYLKKHVEVHRLQGTFDFFREEAERYRERLKQLESQLGDLAAQAEGGSPQLAKELALRRMGEFEARLEQDKAEMAAEQERILALQEFAATVPSRSVTQIRSSSRTLESLQSALQGLELKRTGLAHLFQPGYPELQVVETQIAQTRAAIEELQKAPLTEQVTDRDPTHVWVQSELAKRQAELAGITARSRAIQDSLAAYGSRVRHLARMEISAESLAREAKLAEESYLTFARKQEDARISDELDRHRIVNVAIMEPAMVPIAPTGPSKAVFLLLGALFAAGVSIGAAVAVDRWDPVYRAGPAVEATAGVPAVDSAPVRDFLPPGKG